MKGACESSVEIKRERIMSVLNIFSRLTNRADLMDDMMDKLGVSDEMHQMPNHAGVLRRAANRCLTCEKPDSCQQWLNTEISPDEAPYFCKNHDLFERVLEKMDTKTATS